MKHSCISSEDEYGVCQVDNGPESASKPTLCRGEPGTLQNLGRVVKNKAGRAGGLRNWQLGVDLVSEG